LSAKRQATAMPYSPVAAQIHEAFDVHRDLATQVTFHGELPDLSTKLVDLFFRQILNPSVGRNTCNYTDICRAGGSNPVNRGQRDYGVLAIRDIDACYSGHR
jgi:hypothetical protein